MQRWQIGVRGGGLDGRGERASGRNSDEFVGEGHRIPELLGQRSVKPASEGSVASSPNPVLRQPISLPTSLRSGRVRTLVNSRSFPSIGSVKRTSFASNCSGRVKSSRETSRTTG